MKPKRIASILFLTIFAMASMALGQTTVTTAPVGFVTGTCMVNGTTGCDTIISVPFASTPDYVGTLSGTATFSGSLATIVASGTSPGWTTNQFALLYTASPSYPTYYIKFTSGTLNGKFFTVTANSAAAITFDPAGDIVTSATTGDAFSVVKYWTLGTLFPPSTQTAIVASAGTKSFQRKTTLLLPNLSGTGINLASQQSFYIYSTGTSASWVDTQSSLDATNQILYPDTYFIVRHPSTVSSNTTYTFTGSVNIDRATLPLATLTSKQQDNYVAHQRPVGVTLLQSGLASGFVSSAGTKSFQQKDLLLVFDNTTTGINKAASQTFIMIGSDWYDLQGNNQDAFVLQPGTGFIIRKYPVVGGTSAFWTNDPNFTNN